MIRILLIFTLLFASAWVGIQLNADQGYVMVAYDMWTLETTLSVALLTLLLSFSLLYLTLKILRGFIHLPSSWHQWRTRRRIQKAQLKTRRGLIEFSEGYWQQAKNHLIKALPDADTPLLNYLTAARAAQEMGDSRLRDEYLRKAQHSMPEAKIAVELTQAQLQLANQQWEQALATLRHLQTLAPHHPYVLKQLMHLYQQVKDWPQMVALLPELKSHQVVKGEQYKRLQQHTYLQFMHELIKQNQHDDAKELFAALPRFLKDDPEILAVFARFLIAKQTYQEAEQLLRHRLKKQFNSELITLYGQIPGEVASLDFAESFLKNAPDCAALYLCIGRLSLSQHLWGKARAYFEKSIALKPTPAAYTELGQLLEELSDESGACIAYRNGLLLARQNKTRSD